MLTETEVLKLLRDKIGYDYKRSDMAKEAGVSTAYITEVLKGRKSPSSKVAALVGVKKVKTTSYVQVAKGDA